MYSYRAKGLICIINPINLTHEERPQIPEVDLTITHHASYI